MLFRRKPHDILGLNDILVSAVSARAQSLVHRKVYYRQVILHLSQTNYDKWHPYLNELRNELKERLGQELGITNAPELLFQRTSGRKTYVEGYFEVKPRPGTL